MFLHCYHQSIFVSIIILLWTSANLVQSNSAIRDCSNSNRCVNGVCRKSNDSIRCICQPGWVGDLCDYPESAMRNNNASVSKDAKTNARNDPCSFVPDLCKNGGICYVDGNKFKCTCRYPYTGDDCGELSECYEYCLNKGICTMNGGAPECKCAKEWEGKRCQKLLATTTIATIPTVATTSLVCNYIGTYCNSGTCTFVNNQVLCQCPSSRSGSRCELLAGTTSSGTQPTGPTTLSTTTTTFSTGGTSATARPGVTCAQNPCRNGRPCYNNGATYVCYCGSQYTGINCENSAT